jgi:hypothetical protein
VVTTSTTTLVPGGCTVNVLATFRLTPTFLSALCVQCSMDYLEELDSGTIERLGEQSGFLLGTYEEELAKDPASRATESSRSNVIALWHTIKQIYGNTVARDVANLVNSKLLLSAQIGPSNLFHPAAE